MRPTYCRTCGLYFNADEQACLCPNGTQQWRELTITIPEFSDPIPITAQDIVDHVDLMGNTPPGLTFISQAPLPPAYHASNEPE